MHRLATLLAVLTFSASLASAGALPEVLLSRQLIEARGIQPGDVVRLSAARDGSAEREFRVVAAHEPTPDPFRLTETRLEVRMHLPDMLALTGRESIDRINLALPPGTDGAELSQRLVEELPGLAAVPTDRAIVEPNPFLVLERFHQAVALVTVLGATAFLLSLMIIRAEERRETAGIMRLIGFSRPRILVETFFEGAFVAITGAVVGLLLAVLLEQIFNVFFQWRYDTPLIFVRITSSIAWRCVAVALPLGLMAGLLASWALVRQEIMTLLRR